MCLRNCKMKFMDKVGQGANAVFTEVSIAEYKGLVKVELINIETIYCSSRDNLFQRRFGRRG